MEICQCHRSCIVVYDERREDLCPLCIAEATEKELTKEIQTLKKTISELQGQIEGLA